MNCARLTYYGSAEQSENFSTLTAEYPFPLMRSDPPAPNTRFTPPASSPESSQNTSSVSPETSPSPTVIRMKNKRRGRSLTPSTSRDSEDSSESSRSRISRPPRKRLNHHDKRCLTIQVCCVLGSNMPRSELSLSMHCGPIFGGCFAFKATSDFQTAMSRENHWSRATPFDSFGTRPPNSRSITLG